MHVSVEINTGKSTQHIFNADAPLTVSTIWERLQQDTGLRQHNFYITHNGRIAYETDVLLEGQATIIPKLLGGKGGFGSMLRAIGAQIEKTTNREACRDLSGRRLRDINEEKRLKAWIEKQSTREEEAAERKKKKLAKLCAEPKYEFKDQNYERERSILTERIGDAVEEGFKASSGESSGVKRTIQEEFKPNKRKTILDLDIDSDELDSSDESADENNVLAKQKMETELSNDSGHSSDESNKPRNNADNNETKILEPVASEEKHDEPDSTTNVCNEESEHTELQSTHDISEKVKDSSDEVSECAEVSQINPDNNEAMTLKEG